MGLQWVPVDQNGIFIYANLCSANVVWMGKISKTYGSYTRRKIKLNTLQNTLFLESILILGHYLVLKFMFFPLNINYTELILP